MSRFLKFALGVAVLGVVGLVGLGVLGIFIAVPMASYTHEVNDDFVEEVPARTVVVSDVDRGVHNLNAPAELARVENVDISYPMTDYAVAHTVKVSSIFQVLLFTIVVLVLVSAFVLLLRLTRAKHVSATSDDTALVHELARRAQDLSQRMEALETILLDRTRTAR